MMPEAMPQQNYATAEGQRVTPNVPKEIYVRELVARWFEVIHDEQKRQILLRIKDYPYSPTISDVARELGKKPQQVSQWIFGYEKHRALFKHLIVSPRAGRGRRTSLALTEIGQRLADWLAEGYTPTREELEELAQYAYDNYYHKGKRYQTHTTGQTEGQPENGYRHWNTHPSFIAPSERGLSPTGIRQREVSSPFIGVSSEGQPANGCQHWNTHPSFIAPSERGLSPTNLRQREVSSPFIGVSSEFHRSFIATESDTAVNKDLTTINNNGNRVTANDNGNGKPVRGKDERKENDLRFGLDGLSGKLTHNETSDLTPIRDLIPYAPTPDSAEVARQSNEDPQAKPAQTQQANQETTSPARPDQQTPTDGNETDHAESPSEPNAAQPTAKPTSKPDSAPIAKANPTSRPAQLNAERGDGYGHDQAAQTDQHAQLNTERGDGCEHAHAPSDQEPSGRTDRPNRTPDHDWHYQTKPINGNNHPQTDKTTKPTCIECGMILFFDGKRYKCLRCNKIYNPHEIGNPCINPNDNQFIVCCPEHHKPMIPLDGGYWCDKCEKLYPTPTKVRFASDNGRENTKPRCIEHGTPLCYVDGQWICPPCELEKRIKQLNKMLSA